MLKKSIVLLFMLAGLAIALPQASLAKTDNSSLDEFVAYARKGMTDWKVPGMAMAVVKGGKVVYAKGFGSKRYGTNRPVTPDTVFQVGSTTKAFTVALIAQLVDQGKLGWNDRVVDHFPEFMMYDPWVTREFRIHDLFAQHSGMPAYAGDLQCYIGFDRDNIIHSLRHIKPTSSFRDEFSYVNNLFLVGARIAELKTGKTWEQCMQENILTPLGMTDSSLDQKGMTEAEDGSDLHMLVNGQAQPISNGTTLFDCPYVYGPAGGLNSNVMDMAKWLTAHMDNGSVGKTRIFSRESAAYMHTPRTPVEMGRLHGAYCQGWMKSYLEKTTVTWHNGGTSGICSFIGFSPKLDMGLIVLTNLGGHKLADALGFQFFDMMSGVRDSDWSAQFMQGLKKAEEDMAEAKRNNHVPNVPGLQPKAYAGTYNSPIYGDLTVSVENKDLMISLGTNQQLKVIAEHKTMNTFAGDWLEMDPNEPECNFDFTVDPDGKVTAVTIREFNQDGTMTFIRR